MILRPLPKASKPTPPRPTEHYLTIPSYIPPFFFRDGIPTFHPTYKIARQASPSSSSDSSSGWDPYEDDPWAPHQHKSIRIEPKHHHHHHGRSRSKYGKGQPAPLAKSAGAAAWSLGQSGIDIARWRVKTARRAVPPESLAESVALLERSMSQRGVLGTMVESQGSQDLSAAPQTDLATQLNTQVPLNGSALPHSDPNAAAAVPRHLRSISFADARPLHPNGGAVPTPGPEPSLITFAPRSRSHSMTESRRNRPVLAPIITTFPSHSVRWSVRKPELAPIQRSPTEAAGYTSDGPQSVRRRPVLHIDTELKPRAVPPTRHVPPLQIPQIKPSRKPAPVLPTPPPSQPSSRDSTLDSTHLLIPGVPSIGQRISTSLEVSLLEPVEANGVTVGSSKPPIIVPGSSAQVVRNASTIAIFVKSRTPSPQLSPALPTDPVPLSPPPFLKKKSIENLKRMRSSESIDRVHHDDGHLSSSPYPVALPYVALNSAGFGGLGWDPTQFD